MARNVYWSRSRSANKEKLYCLHRRCWYRRLPASWLQSFVFGCFSLQYFTCFIVATIFRHSHGILRVSWKENFRDIEEFGFKKARGTKRSRPGGEFLACSLSRDPRVAAVGRIGRYLVGGPGDVEATLCRGRPSCLRKSDGGKKKAPVLPRTSHAPSEFASYGRKIPLPGSLQVVNSHRTRVNRPVTERLVSQSPPSHSKRLLSTQGLKIKSSRVENAPMPVWVAQNAWKMSKIHPFKVWAVKTF
jgi:hypothetical protein